MYQDTYASQVKVVVVEDHFPDFVLIDMVCSELQLDVAVDLIHLKDGIEFIEFLTKHPNESFSFFLLDLQNPTMGGKLILDYLRNQSEYAHIPSIVFTSSATETEKLECTRLGASAVVLKPTTLKEFEKVVKQIFWAQFSADAS